MTTLKWGILGPGTISINFSKAIKAVNGHVHAVASRSPERAQAFADTYGIDHAYGSYEELLEDEEIDVVYIATPHSHHFEWVMKSLEKNRHVFCEKAITVNDGQLQILKKEAETRGLILAEAMTIYHNPLHKKIKAFIEEGGIGKVSMINVTLGMFKDFDETDRFFNKDLAGGALLDIGTYALTFARYYLTEQPNEITTLGTTASTGVDEQSGIVLKNEQQEVAVVSLALRGAMPKKGLITGSKGYIEMDNFPRAARADIVYNDGTTETMEAGETAEALQYEVEGMNQMVVNCSNDGTLKLTSDVMKIMDEVREQWGLRFPGE